MEHKYFRNPESTQARGFLQDGSQDHLIPDGWVECPPEQAAAIVAPKDAPITATNLKAIVTAFRWEVETGGITLLAGVRVATGIDDQNRITSVVANAERAGLEEVDFKAAEGWAKVTLAELQAIATAVARHVQACFSAERAHHEAIDALQAQHASAPDVLQSALNAYDVAQGWPSADLRLPG